MMDGQRGAFIDTVLAHAATVSALAARTVVLPRRRHPCEAGTGVSRGKVSWWCPCGCGSSSLGLAQLALQVDFVFSKVRDILASK